MTGNYFFLFSDIMNWKKQKFPKLTTETEIGNWNSYIEKRKFIKNAKNQPDILIFIHYYNTLFLYISNSKFHLWLAT